MNGVIYKSRQKGGSELWLYIKKMPSLMQLAYSQEGMQKELEKSS